MPEDRIRVTFAMWGQECLTCFFGDLCEASALDWLRQMYDKGWLDPIMMELVGTGIVLYDKEEILEKIGG